MNVNDAKIFLESLINHEKNLQNCSSNDFKLDRVKALLALLDNPQDKLKIIHVAGSKGKGSVCAMTANILKEAGLRVGLFTSPHIEKYNERIRLLDYSRSRKNNDCIFSDAINDEDLSSFLAEIKPMIEKCNQQGLGRITFYEAFTALAYFYFVNNHVNIAVIETGLGGRLDATNVASSMISVITPISLEHCHILGNTVEEIAREKAAIIKEGRGDVVISRQKESVLEEILQRCEQLNKDAFDVRKRIQGKPKVSGVGGQAFDVIGSRQHYQDVEISLLGEHQRDNALTTIGIIEKMQEHGFAISPEDIYRGFETLWWPLRFEMIFHKPLVFVDGAHNEESMAHLMTTIQENFEHRKVHVILGVSEDKDIEGMAKLLMDIDGKLVLTQANHPRAKTFLPEEAHKLFKGKVELITEDVGKALEKIMHHVEDEDILLITGSMFVAAQARAWALEHSFN